MGAAGDARGRAAEGLYLTARQLAASGESVAALQCVEAAVQGGCAARPVEIRCRVAAAALLLELECDAAKQTRAHLDRALVLLGQDAAKFDANGPIEGTAKLANAALACEVHALLARAFEAQGNARQERRSLAKGLGIAARGGEALAGHADYFRAELARLIAEEGDGSAAHATFTEAADGASSAEAKAHAAAAAAHCAVLSGNATLMREWVAASSAIDPAASPTGAYACVIRCLALVALGETDQAAKAVEALRKCVNSPSVAMALDRMGLTAAPEASEALLCALEASVEAPRGTLPDGHSASALLTARAAAQRAISLSTAGIGGLCGPPALRALLCHVLESQARLSITSMQLAKAQAEVLEFKASVAQLPAGWRQCWCAPLQAICGLYLQATGSHAAAAAALGAAAAASENDTARRTYASLSALAHLAVGGDQATQAARDALDHAWDDESCPPPCRAVSLLANAAVKAVAESSAQAGRDDAKAALALARSPLQSHQIAGAALRALSAAAIADGDAGQGLELAANARQLCLGQSDLHNTVNAVRAMQEAYVLRRDDAGELSATRSESRRDAEIDAAIKMAEANANDHGALCDWKAVAAAAAE